MTVSRAGLKIAREQRLRPNKNTEADERRLRQFGNVPRGLSDNPLSTRSVPRA
jgi:hypothetical protein